MPLTFGFGADTATDAAASTGLTSYVIAEKKVQLAISATTWTRVGTWTLSSSSNMARTASDDSKNVDWEGDHPGLYQVNLSLTRTVSTNKWQVCLAKENVSISSPSSALYGLTQSTTSNSISTSALINIDEVETITIYVYSDDICSIPSTTNIFDRCTFSMIRLGDI